MVIINHDLRLATQSLFLSQSAIVFVQCGMFMVLKSFLLIRQFFFFIRLSIQMEMGYRKKLVEIRRFD